MDGYSWIALLTLIITVFAVWKVHKRKEYKYSSLDFAGRGDFTQRRTQIFPALSSIQC